MGISLILTGSHMKT